MFDHRARALITGTRSLARKRKTGQRWAVLQLGAISSSRHAKALRMQAALHGRSTEAEVREILAIAVKPEVRVRLGDALAAGICMIVLDTNVISEAMKPEPHPAVRAWLNAPAAPTLYLSSVTLAELLFGIAALPFDTDAVRHYAELAVMARTGGRGFIVASRDTAPYEATRVTVINPWEA